MLPFTYAHVVQSIAESRNALRMIRYSVIGSRHTQARYRAKKEAGEDHDIFTVCLGEAWSDCTVCEYTSSRSKDSTNQMRIDVDSFVVEISQACRRFLVRVGGRSIAA